MGANTLKKLVMSIALLSVMSTDCLIIGSDAAESGFCNMSLGGFMSCKPAVTVPNPVAPGDGCCGALSHANMTCLCSFRNSTLLPTLGIDPALAMQLPVKCNIPHPANC